MTRSITTFSSIITACLISMSSTLALAGDTPSIGGGAGVSSYTKSCPSGTLITGIKVTHSAVVDKIKFRCTTISSAGKWGVGHSWTTYTHSAAPLQSSLTKQALCNTDRFVSAILGSTAMSAGATVLNGIALSCYKSNSNGKRVGSAQTSTVSASPGSWGNWKYCPNKDLAYKAKGKSGWYLDRLRMSCKSNPAQSSSNQSSSNQSSSNQSSNNQSSNNQSSNNQSSNTAIVGGPGGLANYSRSCPGNTKLIGLRMKVEGPYIESLSLQCINASPVGKWIRPSKNTSFTTPTGAPNLNTGFRRGETIRVTCPKHMFVGSLKAKTKRMRSGHIVLSAIGLGCYIYRNDRRWGSKLSVSGGLGHLVDGTSAWSNWKNCPGNKVAYKASGKNGQFLDSLRLACKP